MRLPIVSVGTQKLEARIGIMTINISTPIDADFEVVVGLEVHSQLLTKSKIFCSCSTNYANAAPNTHVCPT